MTITKYVPPRHELHFHEAGDEIRHAHNAGDGPTLSVLELPLGHGDGKLFEQNPGVDLRLAIRAQRGLLPLPPLLERPRAHALVRLRHRLWSHFF